MVNKSMAFVCVFMCIACNSLSVWGKVVDADTTAFGNKFIKYFIFIVMHVELKVLLRFDADIYVYCNHCLELVWERNPKTFPCE